MKRSFQEIIELIIFGLIALVVATLLLWLGGWLLGGVGVILKFLAGLLWGILKFVLPIAIVAGVVYFLVRLVAKPRNKPVETTATTDSDAAGADGKTTAIEEGDAATMPATRGDEAEAVSVDASEETSSADTEASETSDADGDSGSSEKADATAEASEDDDKKS